MSGNKTKSKKIKISRKKIKIKKKEYRPTRLKECYDKIDIDGKLVLKANCNVLFPKKADNGRMGEKYYIDNKDDYDELISYCKENGYYLSVKYRNNMMRLVLDIDQKHSNQHKIDEEEIMFVMKQMFMTTTHAEADSHILEIQEKNRGDGFHIITDLVVDGRPSYQDINWRIAKEMYKTLVKNFCDIYKDHYGVELNNGEIDPAPITSGIRPARIRNARGEYYRGIQDAIVFDEALVNISKDTADPDELEKMYEEEEKKQQDNAKYENYKPKHTDEDLVAFLDAVPKEDWCKYDPWYKLCAIIKKESSSYEVGLSLFLKYSSREYCGYEKFDANYCRNKYDEENFSDIGIGAFKNILKKSKFNRIVKANKSRNIYNPNNPFIDESGTTGSDLFGSYIYSLHKNEAFFVEKNGWYQLNELNYWERSETPDFSLYIAKDIREKLHELVENEIIDMEMYARISNQVSTTNKTNMILSYCVGLFKQDITYLEQFDNEHHLIPFQNGVYDMKNKEFRPARREDKIINWNRYDYKPISNETILQEIKQDFLHVYNDNKEIMLGGLRWMGYNLTGETDKKMMVFHIGPGASNGKTTLFDICKRLFPIHFKEKNSDMISQNSNTSNKAYKDMCDVSNSVRSLYIDELDNNTLDITLVKRLGNKRPTYPLPAFGLNEAREIKLNSKFNLITQTAPVFTVDNGMRDRGYLIRYNNKFTNKLEDRLKYKIGTAYPAKNILDFLDKEQYKYTMLNYLLSWGCRYYEDRDIEKDMPKQCRDDWIECCDMNRDPIQDFISHNLTKDNDAERLYGWELKKLWAFLNNNKEITTKEFKRLNNQIKTSLGVRYDRKVKPTKDARERGITKSGAYEKICIVNEDWLSLGKKPVDVYSDDDYNDPLEMGYIN